MPALSCICSSRRSIVLTSQSSGGLEIYVQPKAEEITVHGIYNLAKQALAKKLLAGSGLSCMAVHPSGDHVIIGSEVCPFFATPFSAKGSCRKVVCGVDSAYEIQDCVKGQERRPSAQASHFHQGRCCAHTAFIIIESVCVRMEFGKPGHVQRMDKRLAWYDLDLSTKPYRSLRYHEKALRGVAYHARHPLFASASNDGALHVFHGMVYQVKPHLRMQAMWFQSAEGEEL